MTELLINIITPDENILVYCDNQYIESKLIENAFKYDKNIVSYENIKEDNYDKIVIYKETNSSKTVFITNDVNTINSNDYCEMRYLKFIVEINISSDSILKIFNYLYGLTNIGSLFYDVDFYEIYFFSDYFFINKILGEIKKELQVFNPSKYSIDFLDLYIIKENLCKDINEYKIGGLPIKSIFKEYTEDTILKMLKFTIKKYITIVGNYFYEFSMVHDVLVCGNKIEELKHISMEKMILLKYAPDFAINLTDEKIDLTYVYNNWKPHSFKFIQYRKKQTRLFTYSDILSMLKLKCSDILGKANFYILYNNLINTNDYPIIIFIKQKDLSLFKCLLITKNTYELSDNIILAVYNNITPEAMYVTKSYDIIISNHAIMNYVNNVTYISDKIYNNLCEVAYIKYEKQYFVDGSNYYYILKKLNKKVT